LGWLSSKESFEKLLQALLVEISELFQKSRNPSVMITGMADPAGMLPKFYKADR
jgi:hypothetical protein